MKPKESLKLLPQYGGIPMQVVPTTFGQGFMNFYRRFRFNAWILESSDDLGYDQLDQGQARAENGTRVAPGWSDGWNDNNITPLANIRSRELYVAHG